MRFVLALISLFSFWSCESEESLEVSTTEWSITWVAGDHEVGGSVLFLPNNMIKITVERPDNFLLTHKEEVLYDLNISDDKFTLIRRDNQFKMTYAILDASENGYLLQYEDDVIVKIYR